MACGCASRMRTILRRSGYQLGDDEVWRKGDHEIPDAKVEDEHFRVLIETLEVQLLRPRVKAFMERLNR